jgi:DNA (cytosine-5)-methyltransferase 1
LTTSGDLTFGSLFAGIGGIDLGLERAGWTGRWQVEYEPYCQRVLAKHWPDVPRYGDIHDVDWTTVEPVDLIAGGFPCQPFSNAGKRLGKDDVRWLWPEFARAVGELRPRYVLVENVPGLLAGHGGMGAVLGDLAALGYDAEWDSIPASAVGAPHLRYRVWIVAYARNGGRPPVEYAGSGSSTDRGGQGDLVEVGTVGTLAYARGLGRGRETALGPPGLAGVRQGQAGAQPHGAGAGARDVPDPFGKRGRGGPAWIEDAEDAGQRPEGPRVGYWYVEPDVGRVAHGVSARVDRLRGLGNAVVPQVVEAIGRRILESEGLR